MGGVEVYRSHIQNADTEQNSKSGLPSKLPAADPEAAFARCPHSIRPHLCVTKAQSHIRCLPTTQELPLELGRYPQPVHVILDAPVARLEVHGNVWQRANDDIESEWTDEIAGVIPTPTVGSRGVACTVASRASGAASAMENGFFAQPPAASAIASETQYRRMFITPS
jgi:hypothetical protein